MRSPQIEPAQAENFLDREAVEKLSCTPKVRDLASEHAGVLLESEVVTHDMDHGFFIYRYDQVLVNEYTGNVKFMKNGECYEIKSKLIICTSDLVHMQVEYHPLMCKLL